MLNGLVLLAAVLTLESRDYSPKELEALIGGRTNLVVRSADCRHPAVITGGRKLTGWQVGADGAWRVTLPEVAAGQLNFSQLFVNGVRRYRPRVPAVGWFEAVEPTRLVKDKGRPDYGMGGFRYAGDGLEAQWANREDLEVQMLFRWNGARLRIRYLDVANREVVLKFAHPSMSSQHLPQHSRFAVENVKEAFGKPGQWYLDRPSGVLAYMPLPGERPETCVVEVPVAESLLKLEGARELTFKDLVFRLDNSNTPADRSEFTSQAEIGVGAAVSVCDSSGIVFEGCRFVNLGGWALAFDERSSDCRVSASMIADGGAGGIRIGSAKRASQRITVEDCEITELGRRHPGGPGIMAIQSVGGRFLRNHIHHLFYTGISVGWGWKVEAVPTSHHNEIAHNHIHDLGLNQLSDMGLVYLLCRQPGTRVHHNYLHDISHYGYGSTGIYPDECSAEEEIDHNVVMRTGRSFHCNMVRDLEVHHNVFVDGRLVQFDFSNNLGEEENLLHLHHNTFVWSQGELSRRRKSFVGDRQVLLAYTAPFWKGLSLHDNVYWRRDGQPAVFPPENTFVEVLECQTLAAFQAASGQEQGSVYRDPGEIDVEAVTGRTGVSPTAVPAEWRRISMPRPPGLDS